MKSICLAAVLAMTAMAIARADGPADNNAGTVRPVPPAGIAVAPEDAERLQGALAHLDSQLAALRDQGREHPELVAQLPDVEIYAKAVRYALQYGEFFQPREIEVADRLLARGEELASLLAKGERLDDGKAIATQAVRVHAYVSKIDGSIQPYRIVIPPGYDPASERAHRLDFWCHGRGETLSELNFIADSSPGQFTPPDAFVVHLYGRYCNANKFAGEIDLFEALADVKRRYPIDDNRVVIRGFSMGGAACWQFAVHYPGRFAAAAPGAGFAETREFLRVFQSEQVAPPWYEQTLWQLYDCTDYAANLFNCPTVAYSGEVDRQKQAADIMATALRAEGMELTHVIGPNTAHSYHPQAKEEINRRIDAIVARGRNPVPQRVRFTTFTLRYPECLWIRLEGLEEHWKRARVDAEIIDAHTVKVATGNVSALRISMPSGGCPLDNTQHPTVQIDGYALEAPAVQTDRSWVADFHKSADGWRVGPPGGDDPLRKIPGLQGPIDDAFLDSFVMVRPTGSTPHERTAAWVDAEMKHAIEHWRKQFRGDARVKDDTALTDADIADSNLVLWGDPQSNRVLARIADQLPIRWEQEQLHVGQQSYAVEAVMPVLIYPNPLNPRRYVVLNSGFTFREYDYLSNARQVPKLPDWALVDTRVPATSRGPGEIVAAGFFDEHWRLVDRP
ncbi:MAG: prolyl oligopeptidase family serine peptidase [Pirellulales bacterium]|nr:prolyl oligopeptidase family serine peptidase [Pirellulales bacterium]